ncbi:MAG: hypothetical protein ACRC1P_01020 [Cellulosilyticaceae bacterium]
MLDKAIRKAKISLRICGTRINDYYQEVFGPVEEKENAFVFEDPKLLEMARKYLGTYERREVLLMMRNKKSLVFTGQGKRPFTKVYEGEPQILSNLFKAIEKKLKRELTQIEKAFLEWEIYNESEQRIIQQVMEGMGEGKIKPLDQYLMSHKLKRRFQKGEAVWVKDLELLSGTLKVKKMTLDKHVG